MVYQPQILEQFYEEKEQNPLSKSILVASIAAGVQYGWALQLSLLTPYIQLLGVPHKWAAFVWLCGPISGLLIQPTVGYYSDRCTCRFGRRRPYIVAGAFMIFVAVILISFAADIGKVLGDSLDQGMKPMSVTIFVLGFWVLNIGNNTLQGPCRALLANISGRDETMLRVSDAMFAFFMAIGNLLGYAAGSYSNLYKHFPFTQTEACDDYCANLKTCFLFSITIPSIVTTFAVILVKEEPFVAPIENNISIVTLGKGEEAVVPTGFFQQFALALKSLSKPMWILLLVTSLNWTGWFPFLLYDTDWMGKEVYGGRVGGTSVEKELYHEGVSAGALGLVWYVLTLAITSLAMEPLVQVLGGIKQMWGLGNFLLAIGMAMTVVITYMADHARSVAAITASTVGNANYLVPPPPEVKWASLCLFALLGIPQAVTYSLPFALTSIISSSVGAGQGLALGVLNLSIVIPQVVVAMVSGPLDAFFGGGNLPAFVMGGIAAALRGVFSLAWLST
ncbi:hypothetical protein CsSME_00034839 [Camellia sinensis var. sinensis]